MGIDILIGCPIWLHKEKSTTCGFALNADIKTVRTIDSAAIAEQLSKTSPTNLRRQMPRLLRHPLPRLMSR